MSSPSSQGQALPGDGDGSPHPQDNGGGAGKWKGAGTRPRLPRGRRGGWGWVPASARTMEGDAGVTEGSWDERWIVVPVFPRAGSLRGTGMGPRMREDNGKGGGSNGRELGRKMDCRPRLPEGRLFAGDGDGSPHPRGQRDGDGSPHAGQWRGRGINGRELTEGSWDERWIVVPVFPGAGSSRGTGMGPRIREDNGRGMRAKR